MCSRSSIRLLNTSWQTEHVKTCKGQGKHQLLHRPGKNEAEADTKPAATQTHGCHRGAGPRLTCPMGTQRFSSAKRIPTCLKKMQKPLKYQAIGNQRTTNRSRCHPHPEWAFVMLWGQHSSSRIRFCSAAEGFGLQLDKFCFCHRPPSKRPARLRAIHTCSDRFMQFLASCSRRFSFLK